MPKYPKYQKCSSDLREAIVWRGQLQDNSSQSYWHAARESEICKVVSIKDVQMKRNGFCEWWSHEIRVSVKKRWKYHTVSSSKVDENIWASSGDSSECKLICVTQTFSQRNKCDTQSNYLVLLQMQNSYLQRDPKGCKDREKWRAFWRVYDGRR